MLDRPDILIVDTETTGFGNRAELVEIGAVDTCGEERFERLILPRVRIPKGASRIHGLTCAVLKSRGARPFSDVEPAWSALVRGRRLLAWNAAFDDRMIAQTARSTNFWGTRYPRSRCLMRDYAATHKRASIGLTEAARIEGIAPVEPRHRAVSDARTALAVMRSVARKS